MYVLIAAAWAGMMAAQIIRVQPHLSANDRSRWCTVWSLVERGTFQIDEIDAVAGWSTIDKVRHDGHFYSSKPALYPTLVAGVYWCLKHATGWDLLTDTAFVVRAILLIVNLLPMLLSLGLIAGIVERHARSDFARYFVVLAAAWGTLLTTFAVTLNNHTPAAVSVTIAVSAAIRILADGDLRARFFLLAGFCAMFACTNELPAALFGLAIFGVLFFHHPRPTLTWFAPAALVPLAGFLFMTYQATGSWKPFYLSYGTETYRYVVDGIPSYWMKPKGIDANVEPPLRYALHCLIGHHGVFSLSPIFLITLAGWFVGSGSLRHFRWMGVLLSVAILAFYLTRTENYNYGGVTSGLRWMFWLIPLWLIGMIPALDRWSASRAFRGLCALFLAVSAFSVFWPISNPWQHPWLYVLMEKRGWIDYSTPAEKFEFPHPLTTWFPSLPDGQKKDWIEFDVADGDAQPLRLRISDGGAIERDGKSLIALFAEWSREGKPESRREFFVERSAFERGAPPSDFLHWPDDPSTPEFKTAGEEFFQGMPRFREYQPGEIRYLRTTLRPEAFECRRAASRVRVEVGEDRKVLWYRTDLWLNDDLPFGVVHRETTVTDEAGVVLSRSIYTASNASSVGTATIPLPDAN